MRAGRAQRIVVVALSVYSLGVGGCERGASRAATTDRPAKPVVVERIELIRYRERTTLPGIVEPRSHTALAFRVDGFVERVHVDEGDAVAAGDILAEIDRTDLQRELEAAEAAAEGAAVQASQAQRELERLRVLIGHKSVSPEEFDAAQSAARAAAAAAREARTHLAGAEDRLGRARLVAPISGFVEQRHVDPHEPVVAAQPAFELTTLDPIRVRAAVADDRLALVAPGREVEVSTAASPQSIMAGRIVRVAVAADRTTRTHPFEVEVANAEHRLMPGMVVEVQLPAARETEAITVPMAAVLRGADLVPFVFAVDEGRAVKRPIQLGDVVGDRIVVRTGVDAHDEIVTRGQHILVADDEVRVVR